MALVIKGFIEIPDFISNVEGQEAAIGELSLKSRTYARDRKRYQNDTHRASELVVFSSLDGGLVSATPTGVHELILEIFDYAYNSFNTVNPFVTQIVTQFPALVDVETGSDIVHTGKLMTTWISFGYQLDVVTFVEVKLWLSDTIFQAEYDEYEIEVLTPAANVLDLASTYPVALAAHAAYTIPVRFNAITNITANDPPTDTQIVSLTWVDPTDSSNTFATEWSVVGYGISASLYENKLDAIRDYLVNNTSYTIAEWIEFFPELDNLDVMYFFPQWNNVALSSSVVVGQGDNLYSTMTVYDDGMDNLRLILTEKPLVTLKQITDVISVTYKSLSVMVIGNEQNSTDNQRFSTLYYDYTVLDVNDINTARLRAITQSVSLQLNRLILQAEVDDGILVLPTDMARQTTGGATFIELINNGITLRVCTKQTYLAII